MSCAALAVPPTEAGFLDFVRNVMGITTAQLPDASPFFTYAYCVSKEIVNIALCQVSPLMYKLAVYNLAGSNLLNWAQDPADAPTYPPNDPESKAGNIRFFAYTRAQYNMLGFVSGVIQTAADETTSDSLVVPESFKDWTLMNLQQAKDPYGRQYIAIASDYGPAAWGLTC